MICIIILAVVCLVQSGLLFYTVSKPSCNATEYEEVMTNLQKCNGDIANVQSTISQLKLNSSLLEKKVINLEKTKKELETEKSGLKEANGVLRSHIEQLEISKPSCNATEYEEVMTNLQKCNGDIANVQSTISQLKLNSPLLEKKVINLEKTKKELETEKSGLKEANGVLRSRIEQLEISKPSCNATEYEEVMTNLQKCKGDIANVQSTISQLKLNSPLLEKKVINLEKTKKELETEKSGLKEANGVLRSRIEQLEISKPSCNATEYEEVMTNLQKCNGDIANVQSTISQLKLNSPLLEKKVINLEKTKKELETEKSGLKEANGVLRSRIEQLEIRLSRIVAADASEENEFVTQLGEYSPQELAEQFSETYDNEYTEAVMEFEKNIGEMDTESTVKRFIDILKFAYDLSTNYSEKHMGSITQSITTLKVEFQNNHEKKKYSQNEFATTDEETSKETVGVSVNHSFSALEWKHLFDIRKAPAYKMQKPLIKVLTEVIAVDFGIEAESQPKMIEYIQKCVSLCWIMNQNQKPVYIDFKEPAVFDTDVYRSFLTSGKNMKYVVWPPLYLNKHGLKLAKGVAEGKD